MQWMFISVSSTSYFVAPLPAVEAVAAAGFFEISISTEPHSGHTFASTGMIEPQAEHLHLSSSNSAPQVVQRFAYKFV
jgi:hypothetical protein